MSLLDDIKGYIDDGMQAADMYRNATLGKTTAGARTAGSVSAGTNPTTTNYSCRGVIAGYDAKEIALAGALIQSGDRKITIFGGSLMSGIVPAKDDAITIQDADGVTRTFTIVEAPSVDEAGAAFICQGRR